MPNVTSPDVTAARFAVWGHVQGVFFRDSTRREARRHGLVGWVRNRSDGGVEVFAQGSPVGIEALAKFLAIGPPHATVSSVDRSPREPDPGLRSFEVRP